jgi:hypothetical protein
MHCIIIEHPVQSFDAWKSAFDGDPVGRAASGVLGYRIMRAVDDPLYVVMQLDFAELETARAYIAKIRQAVAGSVAARPHVRLAEVVESRAYSAAGR